MTTKQMNGSLHKKENMIDNVRKKNKENYICEQDQENRTFTTAFKDYERRTRFVKKTKEKRHKRSMVLLIFYTQMACGQQRKEWTRNWEK